MNLARITDAIVIGVFLQRVGVPAAVVADVTYTVAIAITLVVAAYPWAGIDIVYDAVVVIIQIAIVAQGVAIGEVNCRREWIVQYGAPIGSSRTPGAVGHAVVVAVIIAGIANTIGVCIQLIGVGCGRGIVYGATNTIAIGIVAGVTKARIALIAQAIGIVVGAIVGGVCWMDNGAIVAGVGIAVDAANGRINR